MIFGPFFDFFLFLLLFSIFSMNFLHSTPVSISRPKKGGKGMSLRAKKTDDSFLDALASEGQHVVRKQQLKNSSSKSDNKAAQDAIKTKLQCVQKFFSDYLNSVIF